MRAFRKLPRRPQLEELHRVTTTFGVLRYYCTGQEGVPLADSVLCYSFSLPLKNRPLKVKVWIVQLRTLLEPAKLVAPDRVYFTFAVLRVNFFSTTFASPRGYVSALLLFCIVRWTTCRVSRPATRTAELLRFNIFEVRIVYVLVSLDTTLSSALPPDLLRT